MRVLQLGNYGDDGGGISSVLREFASWEWPKARQSFVDTYATDPRLWGLRRLWVAATTVVRTRRTIDIVHIHLSQKGSFVREGALLRLASMLRLPIVVTVHGSSFGDFARRHRRIVRGVLRRADGIATLTERTAVELRSLELSNVTLVPNAVTPDSVKQDDVHPGDSMVAVFAGEVSRRKGVDVLLEAWPLVVAAHPGARLELYGAATDVHVAPGVPVTVHGRRPRDEVREAVRTARVLVLPSRAEAFPMSILEAMSAGVPVVATDVGEIPRMLDDNELVVPPDDSASLAAAIKSLYVDRGRAQRVGRRNAERFAQLFSPEVVAGKYEALYETVLENLREAKAASRGT